MKISSRQGKRTYIHDENKDRRIRCPEWYFSRVFIENIKELAKRKDMSVSCLFETLVENFFILENPRLILSSMRKKQNDEKIKTVVMTLHPQVIKNIKEYAKLSKVNSSRYIEVLFKQYFKKYGEELRLNVILSKISKM